VLNGGVLQAVLYPTPRFDEDGNPVLDIDGNQIIDQLPREIDPGLPGPPMSAAGANNRYFLSLFDPGGTHEGRLSVAELRLISEWLDIGAQYYNNPFDVPPP
jgi:hypothetical protein